MIVAFEPIRIGEERKKLVGRICRVGLNMIKLYHSKGTRGLRVILLCEELGIEYEVEKVDFS